MALSNPRATFSVDPHAADGPVAFRTMCGEFASVATQSRYSARKGRLCKQLVKGVIRLARTCRLTRAEHLRDHIRWQRRLAHPVVDHCASCHAPLAIAALEAVDVAPRQKRLLRLVLG